MNPINPVLRYWLNLHTRGNALLMPVGSIYFGKIHISPYSPIGFPNWVYNILNSYRPHKPGTYADYFMNYWRLMNVP